MSVDTPEYEVAWANQAGWSPTPTPTGKIALALSKAQGAMGGAKKGSVNPFFKSKYADLGSVCQVFRTELAEQEIAVVQAFHDPGVLNVLLMETILMHSSGERIHSMIRAEHKPGPQEMGKCMTYLRRYGLVAMLVIPQEDDDGNAAQEAYNKPKKQVRDPRNKPNNPQVDQARAQELVDEIGQLGSDEKPTTETMAASLRSLIALDHPDLLDKENWERLLRDMKFPTGKLETWPMGDLTRLNVWISASA